MKTKKSTALLFVLPFIVFFLLFWLLPFGYGLFMSLSKYSLVKGNEGLVGLDNYIKILFSTSMYNKSFMLGLKNTVIFVLLTTPILVFGSLGLALLLDRLPDSIKGIFRTIYFASYSVSVTAVAAVFVWLMKGNGGYLNNMLGVQYKEANYGGIYQLLIHLCYLKIFMRFQKKNFIKQKMI